MPDSEPWWYCPDCHAINNSHEDSRCWNCALPFPSRRKDKPWCPTRRTKCSVCGKSYLSWVLPADTYLRGEEYELGLCMNYFEHYGDNAYYPPMLPLVYMLEGNGWSYHEKTKKITKAKKAPSPRS
jgi:hypothetical protein